MVKYRYITKFSIIIIFLFLSSCAAIYKSSKLADCSKIDEELNYRYSLFDDLTDDEIKRRQSVDVGVVSALDKMSVFSQIVNAVKVAKPNSKLIAIDLRHYNRVSLGNIIVSNVASDQLLEIYLKTSKFSQGFFALINFNKNGIIIAPPFNVPPTMEPTFEKTKIDRTDLDNVELVINVSNSNDINANMKFSKNQKISIIADNITKPYRMDLREASNLQFHFNQYWVMHLYSISGSSLKGGKKTAGIFKFINNKDVGGLKLHKFNKSKAYCYTDNSGLRFY